MRPKRRLAGVARGSAYHDARVASLCVDAAPGARPNKARRLLPDGIRISRTRPSLQQPLFLDLVFGGWPVCQVIVCLCALICGWLLFYYTILFLVFEAYEQLLLLCLQRLIFAHAHRRFFLLSASVPILIRLHFLSSFASHFTESIDACPLKYFYHKLLDVYCVTPMVYSA